MQSKSGGAVLAASPSTDNLLGGDGSGGAWHISSGQRAPSTPPAASPRAPASSPPSCSSSPAPSLAPEQKQAPQPLPIPRPLYLLLRAVYSRRDIASVFDDAIEPEEEEEEEEGGEEEGEEEGAGAAAEPAQKQQQQEQREQQARSVRAIREALAAAAADARRRRPWLLSPQSQDAVGLAVLLSCCLGLLALFAAFARGLAPCLLVVPAAAFLTSLLHELEHDLIHSLYFRGVRLLPSALALARLPAAGCGAGGWRPPTAVDAALLLCYAFRPSTIHPWARRALHLHHHRASGAASDLEERSITNGLPWGPVRLAATGDNLLAIALRPRATLREMRSYLRAQPAEVRSDARARLRVIAANALGYFPLGFAHYALWWSFVAAGLASLALGRAPADLLLPLLQPLLPSSSSWPRLAWPLLRFYGVCFGAPQFLRTFSLHLVSSNVHYFRGRRRPASLVDQAQVVDSPLFWPLQLFCFNFGATHALHHFAPSQPFYLRQAVSGDPRVRAALAAGGVRFNDLGTFARANRLP